MFIFLVQKGQIQFISLRISIPAEGGVFGCIGSLQHLQKLLPLSVLEGLVRSQQHLSKQLIIHRYTTNCQIIWPKAKKKMYSNLLVYLHHLSSSPSFLFRTYPTCTLMGHCSQSKMGSFSHTFPRFFTGLQLCWSSNVVTYLKSASKSIVSDPCAKRSMCPYQVPSLTSKLPQFLQNNEDGLVVLSVKGVFHLKSSSAK